MGSGIETNIVWAGARHHRGESRHCERADQNGCNEVLFHFASPLGLTWTALTREQFSSIRLSIVNPPRYSVARHPLDCRSPASSARPGFLNVRTDLPIRTKTRLLIGGSS